MRSGILGVIALGLCGGVSLADDDAQLVVDSSMSSLAVDLQVQVSIASASDSGATTLSGTIDAIIERDGMGAPTSIAFRDLCVVFDDQIDATFSFGIFGSIAGTVESGSKIIYPLPGPPTAPFAISSVDGSFSATVPVFLVGKADVMGGVLGIAVDQLFNLADFGLTTVDLNGTVTVVGDDATLDVTVDVVDSQVFDTGTGVSATLNLDGTGTVVASGPIVCLPPPPDPDPVITLFCEDFDGLALGPFVSPTESGGDGTDWTDVPPAGWTRDNGTTPVGNPVEFFGFTFFDKDSWIATAGQARPFFVRGSGVIAVADSDEYDDDGLVIEPDLVNVMLESPVIDLTGVPANSVTLEFDSSVRLNDAEFGLVDVSFDGGATFANVVTLDALTVPGGVGSLSRGNERIEVGVNNPMGASGMIVRFSYLDAGGDWWWAIDNVKVTTPDVGGGCNPADLNDAAAPSPAFPNFGVPDGILTPTDFSAFAFYFSTGDLSADINDAAAPSPAFPNFGVPDGILTPTDFSAFAAYFGAGCPCTLPGCP